MKLPSRSGSRAAKLLFKRISLSGSMGLRWVTINHMPLDRYVTWTIRASGSVLVLKSTSNDHSLTRFSSLCCAIIFGYNRPTWTFHSLFPLFTLHSFTAAIMRFSQLLAASLPLAVSAGPITKAVTARQDVDCSPSSSTGLKAECWAARSLNSHMMDESVDADNLHS